MVKIAKKAKQTQKIDRKDLKKDDQFVEATNKSVEWIENNRQLIFGVIIGGIVLMAAGYGFNIYRAEQAGKATNQLSKALKSYQAQVSKTATSTDDKKVFKTEKAKYEASVKAFNGVLKTGTSQASSLSLLFLANSEYRLGKYKDAQGHYEAFLRTVKADDPLYFLGVDGLAYALEGQKKVKESLKTLETYKTSGTKALKGFAILRLAQYYEQKQDAKNARKYYKDLQAYIKNYYNNVPNAKKRLKKNKALQSLKEIAKKRLAVL